MAPRADTYVNYPPAQGYATTFRDGSQKLVPWKDAPAGLVCRPADQDAALTKYTRSKQ